MIRIDCSTRCDGWIYLLSWGDNCQSSGFWSWRHGGWGARSKEIGERALFMSTGEQHKTARSWKKWRWRWGNEERRGGRQNSVVISALGKEGRRGKGKEKKEKKKTRNEREGKRKEKKRRKEAEVPDGGRNDSAGPPENKKGTGRKSASHSEPRLS